MDFLKSKPEPGQESVWDYPRPPRVEDCGKQIQVVFHDIVIAQSTRSRRVLETSHPPVYYIPPEDVQMQFLERNALRTFCEWKGYASYYDIKVPQGEMQNAAWSYETPDAGYESIRHYIAFYPSKMSACYVDGEKVESQPGDFYGGWITHNIVGPFKGESGTGGW